MGRLILLVLHKSYCASEVVTFLQLNGIIDMVDIDVIYTDIAKVCDIISHS